MATVKTQEIDISKVYLDNQNPRHDPIDNEPQVIAHLLAHERVRQLARSIAELGTSPLERFAVTPYPDLKGVFVSLEGNRRLCALKLLHDPDKAPTEAHRKYFRELNKKWAAAPDVIDTVIFKDRAHADPWLAIRHEGEQNGVGTRAWSPRQKERHNRKGARAGGVNPNAQAASLLDYAVNRSLITPDQHDGISITTLTRFLSNPLLRDALGLDTARDLTTRASQEEVDRAAKRFLKDAYAGSGVTSRTSKLDRTAYAERLRKDGIAVTTRGAAARLLDASVGRAAESKQRSRSRHSRSPDTRPNVIPVDFVYPIKEKILKRIYDELRSIDSHAHSFAATYLLRAFIEKTITTYSKQKNIPHASELHITIGKVADALAAQGIRDHQLKPLRIMASDKHSRISPDTLGASIHGSVIPTRAELNRQWDTLEECLKLLVATLT